MASSLERCPGLTATMAAALLIPFTFFMDPVPALVSVVTMSAMAIFAGDIPAALVRIPGTPSSAAYTQDSFELTKQGKAELVLGADVFFSCHRRFAGSNHPHDVCPDSGGIRDDLHHLRIFLARCHGFERHGHGLSRLPGQRGPVDVSGALPVDRRVWTSRWVFPALHLEAWNCSMVLTSSRP